MTQSEGAVATVATYKKKNWPETNETIERKKAKEKDIG